MDDNLELETYLFISPKKLIIFVNTFLDNKIYKEELILQKEHDGIDFNQLNEFLHQNIFKIEKKSKNFIKNVSIILDQISSCLLKYLLKETIMRKILISII